MRKHLLHSTLLCFCTLLSSGTIAQINYKNPNPDSTISSSGSARGFTLKLDDATNNSNVDFIVYGNEAMIKSTDSCEFLCDASGDPQALSANADISAATGTWKVGIIDQGVVKRGLNLWDGGGGNWHNISDRYIGLRFKKNNNWHYGWILASISNTAIVGTYTATAKEYGYNTKPGEAIKAGQLFATSIATHNNETSLFAIHNKHIYLQTPGNITMTSISGQVVLHQKALAAKRAIDISSLLPGIYVLTIQTSTSAQSHKLSISY